MLVAMIAGNNLTECNLAKVVEHELYLRCLRYHWTFKDHFLACCRPVSHPLQTNSHGLFLHGNTAGTSFLLSWEPAADDKLSIHVS